VLSQPLREVQVEALPLEVPEHIDLDVSHMATGDTLRISDIEVPEGVKLLDDSETVVATVTAADPRHSSPRTKKSRAKRARVSKAKPPRAQRPRAAPRRLPSPGPTPPAIRARPKARPGCGSGPAVRGLRSTCSSSGSGTRGREYARKPAQRRLSRRRRALTQTRRQLAFEVLRAARRDPPRRAQGRAAEARDLHERVRARGERGGALLQARARRGARDSRRRRLRSRPARAEGRSAAGSEATTGCDRSRSI